jgi:hypothetical protein
MIATTNRRGPVLFWFPHEVEFLRRTWSTEPPAAIAASLGRSFESVRHKAIALGLRRPSRKRWTDERTSRFLAAADRSPRIAAQTFGLTPNTVRTYRSAFAPNRPKQPRAHWTAAEIQILRDLYPTGRVDEIRRKLPHRSEHSIRQAASRTLGATLRHWLDAPAAEAISRDYRRVPTAQLAERLGMNPDQVRAHARRLGLVKSRNPEATP